MPITVYMPFSPESAFYGKYWQTTMNGAFERDGTLPQSVQANIKRTGALIAEPDKKLIVTPEQMLEYQLNEAKEIWTKELKPIIELYAKPQQAAQWTRLIEAYFMESETQLKSNNLSDARITFNKIKDEMKRVENEMDVALTEASRQRTIQIMAEQEAKKISK